MLMPVRLLLVSAIILTGCATTKKVAVSTFRVLDTPAHYVRQRIDASEGATTTTTTTTSSDVVTNPGAPVTTSPPPAMTTERHTVTQGAPGNPPVQQRTTPSSTTKSSGSSSSQFPTARPVPGKPGFVYSIDPNGGIVDVTGYKSGDKAKDPYTKQIFIVP
jgi:hypothetical protein